VICFGGGGGGFRDFLSCGGGCSGLILIADINFW
jgi:hypothetical protein